MEDLPLEIEEKIEQLPILPFEINEEFQELMFSDLFSDIFNFYKENYLPDTLKTKSEIYQRISLYLNLTGQGDKFTEETDKLLWRRPCPDIHTFLADKFYMGYNNSTLYPFWREKLEYMFRDSSPVRKAIFSGCIGSGKSTVARKAFVYVLYRLLCLRYPRSVLNIDQDATIANVVIATTLKQVYEVNILPFIKLMETMPCFQRVMSQRSFENFNLEDPLCPIPFYFEKSSGTIHFPDNIILTSGSQPTHFTGMNVINSFCFTETTKVYTSVGTITFASLLTRFNRKEKIYTYTIDKNGNKEKSLITDVKVTGYKTDLIRIYYEDDRYIECTPEHPFVISNPKENDKHVIYENGIPYKQAQYLTEEDEIVSEKRNKDLHTKIKKIEKIHLDEPVPVYDLTVENKNHNFALSLDDGTIAFAHNCDEINDYGSVESTIALLNTLDNRFSSRFSNVDLVFQSVVSSARTTNSALGEYVRHLPQNDPSILKLNPMLWEVKPDPDFKGDGTTFPVMVGNGSIPSKIITDPGELKAIEESKYEPPAGCILINVPTIFRSKFELQLDQSIQDIAGITTDDDNSVFRDTTQLEDTRLNPEFVLEVNIRDNTNILDLLKQYDLFEMNLNNTWQFKRAPKADRYGHVDLAGGGSDGQCDAAVCILHKEYQYNEVTKLKDIIYVVDLLLAINAKNKVDIKAIQNFLIDLVVERNIPIHTITADQWQSLMFLQTLEASGCFSKVDKLSVDTKLEPYTNLATMLEQGQVKVGSCPKLKKELEALILDKGKVTRTTELKDLADALVGAVWNAQLNYTDVPIYEYTKPELKARVLTYTDYIDSSSEILLDL